MVSTYEQLRETFNLTVPAEFNFARDVVGRWAQERNRRAMVWLGRDGAERQITFRDFYRRAVRAADAFRNAGIKKGDRVLVVMPRVPAWWETLLGLELLGAVAAPGTTLLTPRDMQYRAELAQATAAVMDPENALKLAQVRHEIPGLRTVFVAAEDNEIIPDTIDYYSALAVADEHADFPPTATEETALLYFTSGTTGYPKMVAHSHAGYGIGHQITGKLWLDLTPNDLHWTLSDTGWAKAAWGCLFGPWSQGAAIFMQDAAGKFDARETLRLLSHYQVTTFCAPPTAYRLLVLEDLTGWDLAELRHCVGAGEPLNPEVIDAWRAGTGLTIHDGYGQTETVLLCGNFPGMEVRPGSMGKPSPGFDVAVIDDEGRTVEPGQEGDIAVRVSPERPVGLFMEYWNDAEATARAMRGDYYVTGDRAYADADGYIWFVGRADDVIISAGYRIGPFEVESALVEHPAVVESAVVASPDPVRGEIVKAFVILAPGYTASESLTDEIQEHVKHVTAPYKYPRAIEYVTELPKTISGKIRRIELREREWAARASAAPR